MDRSTGAGSECRRNPHAPITRLNMSLHELEGSGGTAPTTLRVVTPSLELLAVAMAMPSSLRLGFEAVALPTRGAPLFQRPADAHPPRTLPPTSPDSAGSRTSAE